MEWFRLFPWIRILMYYNYSDEEIIAMTERKTDIFSRVFRNKHLRVEKNGKLGIKNDEAVVKAICKIVKDGAYYLGDQLYKVNTRLDLALISDIIDDLIKKYSLEQEQIVFSNENQLQSTQKTHSETTSTSEKGLQVASEITGKENTNSESKSTQQNEHIKTNNFNNRPNKKVTNVRDMMISYEQRAELYSSGNDIVDQLKYEVLLLSLNKMVISAPIILRSFLQYSFVWYAEANGISYTSNSLPNQIMEVVNNLFNKGVIDRETKSRVKTMINNNDIINLLNDVTHSYKNGPIPRIILLDFYDSIHPIMKIIFSEDESGQS